MCISSVLRFMLLCSVGTTLTWVNDYDEPFLFTCPTGSAINWWESQHDSHHEDRLFEFMVIIL